MRLTTKGRYAVTAMLDISLHADEAPVSVLEISVRQNISPAYLEQIVGKLKRCGLLNSTRGPGGGYVLGLSADDITVSTIVASIGEGVDATRCGGKADCNEGHMCSTHNLWVDLSAQIDGFLQGITLASLMQRHLAERARGDSDKSQELIAATQLG
ncbi:MAG: Rrf2 family transcriptional regulator [Pseudomonadales bacterium]|nr:Rrf2 family transcriptional regulator [Pseudomonadales bacterium]